MLQSRLGLIEERLVRSEEQTGLQARSPDVGEYSRPDDELLLGDDLRPARGLLKGLLLGLAVWAMVAIGFLLLAT